MADGLGTLTYAELAARSRTAARVLRRHGVRPGDRVVVQGRNSVTWVVAAFGALLLGAAVVPIGRGVSARELELLVGALRPRLRVVDAAAAGGGDGAPPDPDEEWVLPVVVFSDLEGLDPDPGPLPWPIPDDDAAEALVLSSSGTSGAVKSVPMTHYQLVRLYEDVRKVLDIEETDRWLGSVPLAHSFGFNGVLLVSMMSGSMVRLTGAYDRHGLARLVRDEALTVIAGPPTIYHDLRTAGLSGHSARLGVVGSTEVAAIEMARTANELGIGRIVTGYGMTETCGTVAVEELPAHPPAPVAPMAPLPGVEIQVRDLAGRSLPPGKRGHIHVRGYNLARPYTSAPDLGAGGWFDTGDIGELDTSGRLAVVGRVSDVVITSGFNVHPREVECALQECPGVAVSAVVGVPDERRGERMVAFIVPAAGWPPDAEALQWYLRSQLPAYKVPSEFVVLRELPLTPTGKLSRTALRGMAVSTPTPAATQEHA